MASSSEPIELEGWALKSISAAVCKELPELNWKASAAKVMEHRQKYFRLFRILEVSGPMGRAIHAAYRPDNSSVFILSGKQECLRLLASIDPVPFRSADDVLAFSAFADKITSADPETAVVVESVDEIGKVAKVANGRLQQLREQLNERVQPPEQLVMSYGFQERFDVLCAGKVIQRTRTIASGGIFFRQDEVLAEGLN